MALFNLLPSLYSRAGLGSTLLKSETSSPTGLGCQTWPRNLAQVKSTHLSFTVTCQKNVNQTLGSMTVSFCGNGNHTTAKSQGGGSEGKGRGK